MSGYTRQQSYIDGDVILAEHTNDELDLLQEVFSTNLGHKHDGTAAEGATIDLLSDDDGDTKIQVEEGVDEDTIRFDTAGVERLTIGSTGDITAIGNAIFNGTVALNGAVDMNSTITVDGATTFSTRPAFNGGTSGVDSPFTVDSTFVVTNLNADLLDGVNGPNYMRLDQDNTYTDLDFRIQPNTSDGNDNAILRLMAGGAVSVTRGAHIQLSGNEHADAGKIALISGENGDVDISSNGSGNINVDSGSSGNVRFLSGALERMRLDSSGNFGIGTTSPDTALNIGNGGTIRVDGSTSGYAEFKTALTTGSALVNASTGSDTGTFVDFNAPDLSTASLTYRLGRNTNTTASCELVLYAHDGTENGSLSLIDDGTINAGSGASNVLKLATNGTSRVNISTTNVTSTLPIRGPDQSASSPTYSFSADTDTGMFWPSANNLGLSTGGTERVRIDSSGNVGINSTSVREKLHVLDGRLEVENSAIGSSTIADAKTKGILLTASGMNTSSKYTAPLMFGSHDPELGASDGPLAYIVGLAEQSFTSSTSAGMGMEFFVNPVGSGLSPTSAILIRNDGRVGLGGSANPSARLEVNSTTQGFLPPRMTTTQRNAISSPAAGLMIYNTSTNKLNFFNGSTWEAVTSA